MTHISNIHPTAQSTISTQQVCGGRLPLVFDYSDCFETRMTACGAALAHALGKIPISPDHRADMID
jgi:hypothetical protein